MKETLAGILKSYLPNDRRLVELAVEKGTAWRQATMWDNRESISPY